MGVSFSQIISRKVEEGYNSSKPENSLKLDEQVEKWRDGFVQKYSQLMDDTNESEEIDTQNRQRSFPNRDPNYRSEVWMRFLRRKVWQVISFDESDEKEVKRYMLSARKLLGFFTSEYKETLELSPAAVPLKDLTKTRIWFHQNHPDPNETTWELYQRFDAKGERRMNQGRFYSLMPIAWQEMKNYQCMNAKYEDCVDTEKWFNKNEPHENETTWELYQRFDVKGERRMNQGQFYSLMLRAWREMKNYQCMNAKYEDCVDTEKWFNKNKPDENETTWELYERFDPKGEMKMNQGHFYSLMPRAWREMKNYQIMDAPYEDCLKVGQWFQRNHPDPTETTWELYQRFDVKGERKMHQGQFYSLLPKAWRQMENYQLMDAPYEDCLKVGQWFQKNHPDSTETTWELYQRFDLKGERRMNQGRFYSLLPKAWRQMENYQVMNATYEDCINVEEWFKQNQTDPNETTWELYQRFDPKGERKMHQGQFYSLMPREWKKMENYQVMGVSYEDCLNAGQWFERNKPDENETTWELYQRFDLKGERRMNQGRFYSLLPKAWRQMENYQVMNATYEDCINVEEWFKQNQTDPNETTWELYQRFDPKGQRKMHQGQFYSLMPRAWREMKNYQCMNAKYEDCVDTEKWFNKNEPHENETTWELYQRFDPKGQRKMNQGHFYSLMPRAWRDMKNYQKMDATYEDCIQADEWFQKNYPDPNETTWELYHRFDPKGERKMNQGHFYSLMPRAWRDMKNYQKMDATYEDCIQADEWFQKNHPDPNETTWELYQRFDLKGERRMHQRQFYSLMPRAWREMKNYQAMHATYEDCLTIEQKYGKVTPALVRRWQEEQKAA